ncbi:MAG: efflux transporter outer membrane subunit [Betaproteobacteria bacterium]|nr:efflux transporter outer membrane subunit [Betaproteobacteria bacterium]
MTPRILPLALALALAGCAVGPDYQRPAAPLPESYGEAAETAAIDKRWWTLFEDATLNELVDQALLNNADLRLAIARVEEADAVAREVGAAWFPEIDLAATAGRSKMSTKTAAWNPGAPRIVKDLSAALTTTYEIDVWGSIRRSNEAARANMLASRYSRDAIRLSIAGFVSSAYLALRAVDAQLAVAAESLASREESLQLVKTRLDAGYVSPLDLHEASSAVAGMQAAIIDFRRQRDLLEHQLALLTANPALKIAVGDLRQLPLPPIPPAGLPADLIEARPDVREAEQRLVAANASIGIAKAGYYPRFMLTGSLGNASKSLGDFLGAGTWTVGLGLFMPLLDFGRTSARVDQATALNEQSLIAWQNSLQIAYKEVRDALVNLHRNSEAEAARAALVADTRDALTIYEHRYAEGYSSYLEVLVAQRNHNDALEALIATRQARLTAAVDLFKALGGGWQAASEEGEAVAVATDAHPDN